jgi:hypothetical protein
MKVKSTLYTPYRRIGGEAVYLHSFLTLALGREKKWLNDAWSLRPQERTPVPFQWETVRAPELVWTIYSREKYLDLVGI